MLSPGWAYSAARKVSCQSSSRAAVPFAHAAHSAWTVVEVGSPKRVAPPVRGWASAMARAAATGGRSIAARATAALSTMRPATISATSASTPAPAADTANAASFQVSWASCGRRAAAGWTRTLWTSMLRGAAVGALVGERAPGDGRVERLVVVVADQLVQLAARLHPVDPPRLRPGPRQVSVEGRHRARRDAERRHRPDDHLVAEPLELGRGQQRRP